MSSKYKVTLFLMVSVSLMLLLFSAGVYFFQYNYSYTDFYKRLETRARIAEKYFFENNDDKAESLKRIRADYLEKLSDERDYFVAVQNEGDLKRIAKDSLLPYKFLSAVYANQNAKYQDNNVFYYGLRYGKGEQTYLIIVSAANYYATHHLILLRNLLIVGLLLSIFIITYLSYYFSKNIFEPISKIIEKVNKISTDNIHLRLEEIAHDKEIGDLISTFNNLLNRIETTLETHKNFISSASHEFGTPLTAIIGEADVALLKERNVGEYKDSLQRILTQAERLNRIGQSLLHLAETGYKENRLSFSIIRTDELILQAKEIMDQLIPKNQIQIDFNLLPENSLKLKVMGNKELLLLSFTNVLTNACKYSDNKPVLISLAATNSEVVLLFKDNGIGIPASEMPFIYDPFFRASNTLPYDGYGIGLPLTRNIVRIHKGFLNVTSVEGKGVTVEIRLPIAVL